MLTFLGTVHILACLALIVLAMMQDSKGGGLFDSQTSSNSILGATGGASLAVTMTKILSVIILITCIAIAMVYTHSNKSVIDGTVTGSDTRTNTPTTIPPAGASQAIPGNAGAPPPADTTQPAGTNPAH